MLNDKRYSVERFSDLDDYYFSKKERAYLIEPGGFEKNKHDLFSDFLASFIYKHIYKDSLKNISEQARQWEFDRDFEKLMSVYAAVDEARSTNHLQTIGMNVYVNHVKSNGIIIKIDEDFKDKLQNGMYEKIKEREEKLTSNTHNEDSFPTITSKKKISI